MKKITIAFDVDGTLLDNAGIPPETPPYLKPPTSVNLEIVLLLQILSKKMKNARIIVWSGGGKEYVDTILRRYGLMKYIDATYGKGECSEKVDICFDDVHACELAEHNLIVKMK